MKRIIIAAVAILAAIPVVSAAMEEKSRAEVLAAGKASFEKKCSLCHSLGLVLSKVKTRAEWTHATKRMVTYGAPLNTNERDSVVSYLSARSSFERNCNSCHEPSRVVPDDDGQRDWKAILERMSSHLTEKKKKEAPKGEERFSDEDIREIAAFLTVILKTE